jgi:hypothetical protein
MWRRLFHLIAALFLCVACAAPAVAQPPREAQKQNEEDDSGPNFSNAGPYAAAGFSTLLVLLIVCKPSRKS